MSVINLCGCPRYPGRRVTDPQRHAEWHARCAARGLTGAVTAAAVQSRYGHSTVEPAAARKGAAS